MHKFLPFVAALLMLPAVVAQEADTLQAASDNFNQAWLSRDVAATQKFAAAGATVFSLAGTDATSLAEAIRKEGRSLRDATSSETVVSVDVKVHGATAIVTRIARIDHTAKKRQYSSPQRQTEFWVKTNGAWKLSHMHQSAYTNFASAINAFERADAKGLPKPGGVVFVGSSSIRMWKTLNEDFPDTNNVHRGFGGSQLIDSIVYVDRLITKYAPSKVVVYAGDNDVGAGKNAERVLQDFKTLVTSIHKRLPDAQIGFIAIKPSRARWKLWSEMAKANKLVAEFAKGDPKLTYFDIATPMLANSGGGMPAADWFIQDGLHMTPKGYAAWTKVIRPWVDAR
ncbi:MAG: GDSL-type esterase/lipase family protein [Planctomycetaceae bacterium]